MATVDAFIANWLAWRAESAFWVTVEFRSAIDAAVSCRRWPVVRCAIGQIMVALLNFCTGRGHPLEPERTVDTTSTRLVCMSFSADSIIAVSLLPSRAMSGSDRHWPHCGQCYGLVERRQSPPESVPSRSRYPPTKNTNTITANNDTPRRNAGSLRHVLALTSLSW